MALHSSKLVLTTDLWLVKVLELLIWRQRELTPKSARHCTEERSVHTNHADQSLTTFLNCQHHSGLGQWLLKRKVAGWRKKWLRWQGRELGSLNIHTYVLWRKAGNLKSSYILQKNWRTDQTWNNDHLFKSGKWAESQAEEMNGCKTQDQIGRQQKPQRRGACISKAHANRPLS